MNLYGSGEIMKKKTIFILIICIIIVGISIAGIFYFSNNKKESTKFNLDEQRWIEKNKNNVIDFYLPSDIDVFSYNGKGVLFDFLDSFSSYTGLSINKTYYKKDNEINKEYAFKVTEELDKNDYLIYKDNYVIVGYNKVIYKQKTDLKNLKIGVLTSDEEVFKEVFKDIDLNIISYETFDEMYADLVKESTDETEVNEENNNQLDAILVMKTSCLNYLFENDLHINYQIDEMYKNFVISLNGDDVLNSIFYKYYKKWMKDEYNDVYNSHLLNEYFELNNVTELDKNKLQEKKYVYGFVNNGAYDVLKKKKLYGINYQIIKSFASFANIDMDYNDAYMSYDDLIKDFDNNKVDLFFKNGDYETSKESYNTISFLNTNVVILINVNNDYYVNGFYSLKDKTIHVVKNSYIEKKLSDLDIKTKSYNSIDKLLSDLKDDTIIAIDMENYEYYKSNKLVNFKIAYNFDLNNKYSYIINADNSLFGSLFDFYLEYANIDKIVVKGYKDIYHIDKKVNYLLIISILMFFLLCLEFLGHMRKFVEYLKNKTKHTLTKNDKLKYIDPLTSLKNRLYLNDTIEKWDNSAIYPQSIIVVELNDLSEINSNFGHEEGDKVILEAVNILIRTQLANTEIIRTNGSEFLIYMIGYDEKQTVAYLRKLNKELRELSHGYGAVTGYSIITDGIKTIDDAINEATLDVRTNKELLDEEQ